MAQNAALEQALLKAKQKPELTKPAKKVEAAVQLDQEAKALTSRSFNFANN